MRLLALQKGDGRHAHTTTHHPVCDHLADDEKQLLTRPMTSENGDASWNEYDHAVRNNLGGRRPAKRTGTAQVDDVGLKVSGKPVFAGSSIVLDPADAGITQAIKRLEQKSFIKDVVIAEIQCLLRVPSREAKHAYLQALAQYGLVCMLVLASLLGSALSPLDAESYPTASPGLVAAYNMLSIIICTACLFGACVFLLEGIIMEGTEERRVHGIIARSDKLFFFGVLMTAVAIQATAPLMVLRAWISGLETIHAIALTVICELLHLWMMYTYFTHLQTNWPEIAQLWTKVLFPCAYRKQKSFAAIDELVAELKYLQQPRDKVLTAAQLGEFLGAYFGTTNIVDEGAWVLSGFLQHVENELGGRLAPTAERLAKKAFEKALDLRLEKIVEQAVDHLEK